MGRAHRAHTVSHSHDNNAPRSRHQRGGGTRRLCAYQLCRIRNPDYVDTFIMKHFFNALGIDLQFGNLLLSVREILWIHILRR
jgi:hypothetical protein